MSTPINSQVTAARLPLNSQLRNDSPPTQRRGIELVPRRVRNGSFATKTQLLTGIVVITNVIGNLLLSEGMHRVGKIVSASPADYVRAFVNPWVIGGSLILVIWMIGDLALLSRADLSFVLPVTASAYVLIAIAAHLLLSDHISWERWLGIVVITLGVILAEETPTLTAGRPPEDKV